MLNVRIDSPVFSVTVRAHYFTEINIFHNVVYKDAFKMR